MTVRGKIEPSPAVESFQGPRWHLRLAIVRGRLDVHNPRRESVRAAIERHFPDRNPRRIEVRFLEWQRRRRLVHSWLERGSGHPERVVRIEGLSHLEEALLGGAGAILASAHLGHGRLIKPVLHVHGWSALLVGGRPDRPRPWPPMAAEDLPVSLNLRPHLAALRANKPLIILMDGPLRGARGAAATSFIRVAIRGVGIRFSPGPLRIAQAAGAPVLPTFVVDEGTFRDPLAIRLVIHPPLTLQSSPDPPAGILENIRQFAAVFADELERNPHNLDWSKVSESGEYLPPRHPELWKSDNGRTSDITGSLVEGSPAHGG